MLKNRFLLVLLAISRGGWVVSPCRGVDSEGIYERDRSLCGES